MGLDMYAMKTTEPVSKPFDFEVGYATKLHSWRKHPNLHGWMQELYYNKGGEREFNCVSVLLTLHDLERLQRDIERRHLPKTSGFFFGESDGSEVDDDLLFIGKARKAIRAGYSVFYDSWW